MLTMGAFLGSDEYATHFSKAWQIFSASFVLLESLPICSIDIALFLTFLAESATIFLAIHCLFSTKTK